MKETISSRKGQGSSILVTLLGVVIGIVIIFLGFSEMFASGSSSYNVTYNGTQWELFNKTQQLTNITNSAMSPFLNNTQITQGSFVDSFALINSIGITVMRVLTAIPGILISDLANSAYILSITNGTYTILIGLLVAFVFIALFLYLLLGRR